MSFDPTHLVSQLTALNREDGDLRLICDGVVVKAHSFILSLRYGARENFLLLCHLPLQEADYFPNKLEFFGIE